MMRSFGLIDWLIDSIFPWLLEELLAKQLLIFTIEMNVANAEHANEKINTPKHFQAVRLRRRGWAIILKASPEPFQSQVQALPLVLTSGEPTMATIIHISVVNIIPSASSFAKLLNKKTAQKPIWRQQQSIKNNRFIYLL